MEENLGPGCRGGLDVLRHAQEEELQGHGGAADGEVNPETPAPVDLAGKHATNQGPNGGGNHKDTHP